MITTSRDMTAARRRRHGSLALLTAHSCTPTPPPVTFVRGEGTGSGTPTARSTSTSSAAWPSRRSATPTPRWPTPSPSRPAPCSTSRTCTAPTSGPRWPRPSTGSSRGPGWPPARARCSSPTPGPRPTSARSSWPAGGGGRGRRRAWSAPTARSTAAPWPPCRHRPAAEARAVPAAARGLPPRGLGRPRRPRRRRSTRAVAAVLLEPVQGEGGVNPATAGVLPRRAAAVRRARRAAHARRGADRPRPHRAVVRLPAPGVRPDVVTMAKALGNGMPIGACWARAEVAAAFEPGDHGTTFGGQPLAAAAALADARGHGGRGRAGPGRAGRARGSPPGSTRCPGSPRSGASACCSPPSSAGNDARDVAAARPRRRPGGQRGHARPRCAWRRRCSCPTPRSTRRRAS